jgi:hypothetical protein
MNGLFVVFTCLLIYLTEPQQGYKQVDFWILKYDIEKKLSIPYLALTKQFNFY